MWSALRHHEGRGRSDEPNRRSESQTHVFFADAEDRRSAVIMARLRHCTQENCYESRQPQQQL